MNKDWYFLIRTEQNEKQAYSATIEYGHLSVSFKKRKKRHFPTVIHRSLQDMYQSHHKALECNWLKLWRCDIGCISIEILITSVK